MKPILLIAIALMFQSDDIQAGSTIVASRDESRTVSFNTFEIKIPSDWRHVVSDSSQGVVASIFPPDGEGILRLKSQDMPSTVTRKILRNLTNVESSTLLKWQSWGDLDGYQYSYFENGKFYTHWWLTDQRKLLFLSYSSGSQDPLEVEIVTRIVASLTSHT